MKSIGGQGWTRNSTRLLLRRPPLMASVKPEVNGELFRLTNEVKLRHVGAVT